MLSIENLRSHHSTISGQVAEMQRILDGANAKAESIVNDSSRSAAFKATGIAEIKKSNEPRLLELFKKIHDAATLVAGQRRFYENKKFMLSRQRFNQADAAVEATLRASKLNEFELTDEETLELIAESAKDEGRLAQLWLAILAGSKIDLSDVRIDEQATGLDFLKKIEGLRARAELLMRSGGVAPFKKASPAQKMHLGGLAEAA